MKTSENIAKIILEPKTHRIKHITLYNKSLRFHCKRCATFCCKLGGPKLSMKDVERLKKAGCIEAEFLDTTNDNLKNTSSGSCVLLRFDAEKSVYECAVYQHRPTLCRLYPFHFEKKSPNAFALQVMPCRGINQSRGEFINEDFIVAHLLDALNDLGL